MIPLMEKPEPSEPAQMLGTGFGDRFEASPGVSGPLEKRWTDRLKRRKCTKTKREARFSAPRSNFKILHGKEGVRGSSPREGFGKFLLISSFRRLSRRQKPGAASTERPRHGAAGALECAKPSS
jgi:hypothetical protein